MKRFPVDPLRLPFLPIGKISLGVILVISGAVIAQLADFPLKWEIIFSLGFVCLVSGVMLIIDAFDKSHEERMMRALRNYSTMDMESAIYRVEEDTYIGADKNGKLTKVRVRRDENNHWILIPEEDISI